MKVYNLTLALILLALTNRAYGSESEILDRYYQSLMSEGSYYVDGTVNIEYNKNDIGIEEVLAEDVNSQAAQSFDFVMHKEWKSSAVSIMLKFTDNTNSKDFIYYNNKKPNALSHISYDSTGEALVNNNVTNHYPVNYFLIDYLEWAYGNYNYRTIKENNEDAFIQGSLKKTITGLDLFNTISIRYSKKYELPTKIYFLSDRKRVDAILEVQEITKIGNKYYPKSYTIKEKEKNYTVILNDIVYGVMIDDTQKFSPKDYQVAMDLR